MRRGLRGHVRVVWILTRVVLHIVAALLLIGVGFRLVDDGGRRSVIRWWSARLLAICGLRMRVVDAPSGRAAAVRSSLRPGQGAMLVLNHVSWIDVFVVHALRPAHFVAKAEIAGWPVFGYVVARTGAIFIERGKRHAVREANLRAAECLAAGDLVGMFPEGTVGDGQQLLPFHANLIQAAIQSRVPIVVAALRYRDRRGERATAMDFVGDVTMLQSLVRIARDGPIDVELHLIETIDAATTTRHEAARKARRLIAERLGLDDEARGAADGGSPGIALADDLLVSPDARLRGMAPGTPPDPRDELL